MCPVNVDMAGENEVEEFSEDYFIDETPSHPRYRFHISQEGRKFFENLRLEPAEDYETDSGLGSESSLAVLSKIGKNINGPIFLVLVQWQFHFKFRGIQSRQVSKIALAHITLY
jgi:hypothetical protein